MTLAEVLTLKTVVAGNITFCIRSFNFEVRLCNAIWLVLARLGRRRTRP